MKTQTRSRFSVLLPHYWPLLAKPRQRGAGLGGLLALLCPLSTAAHADKPFTFASTPGQLPKVAKPVSYDIIITPNLKTMTTSGAELVDINVLTPTRTVTLNALNMTVTAARINTTLAKITPLPKKEMVALSFSEPLAKGRHTLVIDFTGKIIEQPQGLFATKYQSPTGPKTMLSTQMEATDARRFFPCWDEPVYRASYQLTVTVPQKWMAVSNMPIAKEIGGPGIKTVSFQATPPMASYLVAFCAGEFESVSGKAGNIPVRVITTAGKKASALYALDAIEHILPFYNSYFGVNYPLPKMDLVAIPGGFPGAMENWGCITYNDSTVLYDPKRSSPRTKEEVFHVIAHETAHQWFGDLVTMSWWDNLWLNEGFASWMDLKATDHFHPEWNVWLEAGNEKDGVMDTDARATAHSIQQAIADPAQASQAFDNITYIKGQSVIRMVETYLGEAKFRDGIRRYMAAHKYSNTTTADLWKSLTDASHKPVASVAGSFTTQPGFPLVTADFTSDKQFLTLTQQRFFIDGTPAGKQLWQVPVSVATLGKREHTPSTSEVFALSAQEEPGGNIKVFPIGKTGDVLLDKHKAIGFNESKLPVIVNKGNVGYYRVRYEGQLLDAITKAAPTLQPADQLALLNDGWALAQANLAPPTNYLNLAQSLKNGDNVAVWQQILGTLASVDQLEQDAPGRAAFQAYEVSLVRPLVDKLGYTAKPGESEDTAKLRTTALGALGRANDPATVQWAQAQFAAFLKDENAVPPALRGTVVGIVGRNADQAAYDRLLALGRKSMSFEEKQRYYFSLASAQDPKLAQQTLNLALTDELPPPYGPFLVYAVAGSEHSDMAWDFVKAHKDALLAKMDAMFGSQYVPGVAGISTDPARADELTAYAKANLSASSARDVAKAVSRIRTAAAQKARLLPSIDTWVAAQSKTAQQQTFLQKHFSHA